jgi:hypothetical protein
MLENPNFKKIRSVEEEHNKISNQKREFNPSDYWPSDRKDASEYFIGNPKIREKIKDYFDQIHAKGESVVYVDVCGRAIGEKFGADKSYSFSFAVPGNKKILSTNDSQTLVYGDVLNSADFSQFLKMIKEEGIAPALVTFNPVAGLSQYNSMSIHPRPLPELYDEVTYQKLIKNFENVITLLRPGGYFYLSGPFVDMDPDVLIAKVTEIAHGRLCEIEVLEGSQDLPYFLIRKPPAL